MQNKFYRVFCVIISVLFLFSCDFTKKNTDQLITENTKGQNYSEITDTINTDKTEDVTDNHLYKTSEIHQTEKGIEIEGIDLGGEAYVNSCAFISDRHYLISFTYKDSNKTGYAVYDIKQNAVTDVKFIDGNTYTNIFNIDGGCAFGSYDGYIYIYKTSSKLNNPEYSIKTEINDEFPSDYLFIDTKTYIKTQNNTIYVEQFEGNTLYEKNCGDELVYLYPKYKLKNYVYFGANSLDYKKTYCAVLNLTDYTFKCYETTNSDSYQNFYSGTVSKEYEKDDIKIYDHGSPEVYTTLKPESSNESPNDYCMGYITTAEYSTETETSTVRIYSCSDGTLIFRDNGKDNNLLAETASISQDGKYAMIRYRMLSDETSYTYLLVNLSELSPIERQVTDAKESSSAVAEELSHKYGVTIKTAENAIRFFPDFAAIPLYNEDNILRTLNAVDEVLSKFPENFIGELLDQKGDSPMTSYVICITGRLIRGNNTSTNSPIAYAFQDFDEKVQYMVLDGTYWYGLESTIAHELMHAIDCKISQLAMSGYTSGFSKWNNYLPKGFDYNWSYINDDGGDYNDNKYTTAENLSDAWFVDAYSKTFPCEDKARIFENLFAGDGSCFQSSHLAERAKYLCKVLRKSFKSLEDANDLYWERYLNEKAA